MKIFNEGILWTRLPDWRGAGRLVGLNITRSRERTVVEPIYQKVISFERAQGCLCITLAWEKPWAVIILMSSFPFINIVNPDGYTLEEE